MEDIVPATLCPVEMGYLVGGYRVKRKGMGNDHVKSQSPHYPFSAISIEAISSSLPDRISISPDSHFGHVNEESSIVHW